MEINLAELRAMHPRLPEDLALLLTTRAALGLQRNGHESPAGIGLDIERIASRGLLAWVGCDPASLELHDQHRVHGGTPVVNADSLHTLVTSAIWRAEQLEEHRVRSASLAWAEVSVLEEELATALPVSLPEGRIARRGAVRAALKARDYARAHSLAQRYLADDEAPESLRTALATILEDDARLLAEQFRYAAKHHAVDDARELARRLHKGGAFGLAA